MILLELFWGFLKVGAFAFGGAYAAIPLIRDIVLSYGWIGEDTLAYMIAVSESTPGPIMVNLATYVGSSQAGLAGALTATAAVVLPSFIIILLITAAMKNFIRNRYVQAALSGLKPCVIGIILATGLCMVIKNCLPGSVISVKNVLITVILCLLYFGSRYVMKKNTSPIMLIILSALIGIIAG